MSFNLHTEPRINPPEFTVTVQWIANNRILDTNANGFNQSQLILDTSNNSVYANKLHIRGRTSWTYSCEIFVFGKDVRPLYERRFIKIQIDVAGEPMNLTAVVSESNCTTVNITVSWEPPLNTPTGYVIYYQQRGQAASKNVMTGDISSHMLEDLQRGVTYNISIVALSHHLPSLLVGPVTVYQSPLLLITETPHKLLTFSNTLFSVGCTVVAEYDGQPLNTTLTWTRITTSPMNMTTESVLAVQEFTEEEASILSSSHSGSGSGFKSEFIGYSSGLCNTSSKWGYRSFLKTTENITNDTVIYHCNATTLGNSSFSDTTVVVKSASDLSYSLISSTTSFKTLVTTPSRYFIMSTEGVTTSLIEATETSKNIFPTKLPISSRNNRTSLRSSTVLSNEPVQRLITSSLNNVTLLSSITVTTAESPPPDTGTDIVIQLFSGVIAVLLITMLLGFYFCIICFKRKDKRKDIMPKSNTVNSERKSQSPTQLSADYEEVDLVRDVKTTQDIQLISNKAYGPVKLMVPTSPNVAYGQVNVAVLQRSKSNN